MSKMTNSMIVANDDVSESVIDGLIDQLGELPNHFEVTIVVTVVVTPLPEGDQDADNRSGKFNLDLWKCAG